MANKRLAKKRAKQEAAKAVEVKVEAPVVEEAVVETETPVVEEVKEEAKAQDNTEEAEGLLEIAKSLKVKGKTIAELEELVNTKTAEEVTDGSKKNKKKRRK